MPVDPLTRHVAPLVAWSSGMWMSRFLEVVLQRGERPNDVEAPIPAKRTARTWTSGGPRRYVKAGLGNDFGRAGARIDGDPIAAIDRQHRLSGTRRKTPVAALGTGMEMMGTSFVAPRRRVEGGAANRDRPVQGRALVDPA